jgi:PIN domain nuclease of toxin-antitoxin system
MSSRSLLIDTQVFLWLGMQSSMLSEKARAAISDERTELFFSVASVWEISIKKSIGKLKLPVPTTTFISSICAANGIVTAGIEVEHAIGVEEVEKIHSDPFDRLLVSQTRHLGLAILSSDQIFDQYKVPRIW